MIQQKTSKAAKQWCKGLSDIDLTISGSAKLIRSKSSTFTLMLSIESQLGHGIVRLFAIGILVLFVVFVILLIIITNYKVNQARKKLGDAYVPKERKPLAPGIIVAIVLAILGIAAVVIIYIKSPTFISMENFLHWYFGSYIDKCKTI